MADYTDSDLSLWTERVRTQAWERTYVFFKHEEKAMGPKMAMRFGEMVGAVQTAL